MTIPSERSPCAKFAGRLEKARRELEARADRLGERDERPGSLLAIITGALNFVAGHTDSRGIGAVGEHTRKMASGNNGKFSEISSRRL